eukprot:gene12252-biopygen4926
MFQPRPSSSSRRSNSSSSSGGERSSQTLSTTGSGNDSSPCHSDCSPSPMSSRATSNASLGRSVGDVIKQASLLGSFYAGAPDTVAAPQSCSSRSIQYHGLLSIPSLGPQTQILAAEGLLNFAGPGPPHPRQSGPAGRNLWEKRLCLRRVRVRSVSVSLNAIVRFASGPRPVRAGCRFYLAPMGFLWNSWPMRRWCWRPVGEIASSSSHLSEWNLSSACPGSGRPGQSDVPKGAPQLVTNTTSASPTAGLARQPGYPGRRLSRG